MRLWRHKSNNYRETELGHKHKVFPTPFLHTLLLLCNGASLKKMTTHCCTECNFHHYGSTEEQEIPSITTKYFSVFCHKWKRIFCPKCLFFNSFNCTFQLLRKCKSLQGATVPTSFLPAPSHWVPSIFLSLVTFTYKTHNNL